MHPGGAATGGADLGGAGKRRGADVLRAGGGRRCEPAAGEALQAGGQGRRCGDGLAAGGAAALAPGAAPADLVFFHFFFF